MVWLENNQLLGWQDITPPHSARRSCPVLFNSSLILDLCLIYQFISVSFHLQAVQGTGLAFIAFTEAMTHFPASPFWSVMFFFMLINLGLGSMIGTMTGITTPILDTFKIRKEILTGENCHTYTHVLTKAFSTLFLGMGLWVYVIITRCLHLNNELLERLEVPAVPVFGQITVRVIKGSWQLRLWCRLTVCQVYAKQPLLITISLWRSADSECSESAGENVLQYSY